MNKKITIALAGLGGYSDFYADALLDECPDWVEFSAAVSIKPEASIRYKEIKTSGVPLFGSLGELYENMTPDLLCIPLPIHLHSEQIITAVNKGSHVLCEKPLCSSEEEIKEISQAEKETGKVVAVGYQWAFSSAVARLKNDIRSGVYGIPKVLKSIALWHRSTGYFKRNDWAGRITDDEGRPVYDSVVHNACSHFLFNMLYLLGEDGDSCWLPGKIEGELYRINEIENFDTAVLKMNGPANSQLLFYASHAVPSTWGPVCEYVFEKGRIFYSEKSREFIGRLNDGTEINYGDPDRPLYKKIWDCADNIRTGNPPVCGVKAAAAEARVVAAIQKTVNRGISIPSEYKELLMERGTPLYYGKGIMQTLKEAYENECLPTDLTTPWSQEPFKITVPGGTV